MHKVSGKRQDVFLAFMDLEQAYYAIDGHGIGRC